MVCGQKDVRTEEKALLVVYFKLVRTESKDIKTCADNCAVSKTPNVFARPIDSTRIQWEDSQVLCGTSKALSEVSCFTGLNKEGIIMWNIMHAGLHQGQ